MTFASHDAMRSDEEALALANENRALALHVARKMFGGTPHLADMEQNAWLALYRAAQIYDPTRGANFCTYAFACIRRQLLRAWRRTRCVGHIPEHVSMAFRAIERDDTSNRTSEVEERLDETMPRTVEIDTPRWDARSYFTFAMGERSLSEVVWVGDADHVVTLLDTLPDEEIPSPEEPAEAMLRASLARRILAETPLNDREREVIERRFLCGDGETLQEIADTHGLSRERIRQIEARGLAKLRRHAGSLRECA